MKFTLAVIVAAALVAAACADTAHEETHRRLANCHSRGATCEQHDHRCHHDASVCYMSVGEALEHDNNIHLQYAAVHAMGCRAAHWIAAGRPAVKPEGMASCMMPDPRLLLDLDAEAGRRLRAVAATSIVTDCDNFDDWGWDDSHVGPFDWMGSSSLDQRPTSSEAYDAGRAPPPVEMLDDSSFGMHVTGSDHVRFAGSDIYGVYDEDGRSALIHVKLSSPTDDYYCMLDFGDPNGEYGMTFDFSGFIEGADLDDDGNFLAVYVITYATGEWERVYMTGDDDELSFYGHIYAEPGQFVRWIHYTDDDEQLGADLYVQFGKAHLDEHACDVVNEAHGIKYLPQMKKWVTNDNQGGDPDFRFQGTDYWLIENPHNSRKLALCSN